MLATIAALVGIASGVAGIVFGVIQHRGKAAEGERANRAEQAKEQMAAELTAAREELAGSRQAHERLADLEHVAVTDAQEAARQGRVTERRQERDRKAHDRKVLAENQKQTRIKKNALKELKRQGRKK